MPGVLRGLCYLQLHDLSAQLPREPVPQPSLDAWGPGAAEAPAPSLLLPPLANGRVSWPHLNLLLFLFLPVCFFQVMNDQMPVHGSDGTTFTLRQLDLCDHVEARIHLARLYVMPLWMNHSGSDQSASYEEPCVLNETWWIVIGLSSNHRPCFFLYVVNTTLQMVLCHKPSGPSG